MDNSDSYEYIHGAGLSQSLKELQESIHKTALSKGWWIEHDMLRDAVLASPQCQDGLLNANIADQLYIFARSMLIVSEVSEGIEALRCNNAPDDKLPEFPGVAVELADAIIRIFDLAERFNLPVIEAMMAKTQYNTTRSYKHGGKSI